MIRPGVYVLTVAVAWYVGLLLNFFGKVPGPWWLWAAPFYLVVATVLFGRVMDWRERRHEQRRRRLTRAENLAFFNGVGLRPGPRQPRPDERAESADHSLS